MYTCFEHFSIVYEDFLALYKSDSLKVIIFIVINYFLTKKGRACPFKWKFFIWHIWFCVREGRKNDVSDSCIPVKLAEIEILPARTRGPCPMVRCGLLLLCQWYE